MKFEIKPKAILDGFSNLAKKQVGASDPEIEELSAKRMAICELCEHIRRTTNRCGECGCILAAKTRTKHSQCPIKKW
jgi:hypothetical protein